MTPGALYLVPTPLDFGVADTTTPLEAQLPGETLATAGRLTHWIAENAKSARAFLKRVDAAVGLAAPLQAQRIVELPRQAHKHGDHSRDDPAARDWLSPALQGHDVGLLSEAGMPAIADPGSGVVRAAHAMGLRVCPLVGPVSLMLALAGSGLNGQHFAFSGYVPQDAAARTKRLRELDALAARDGQSQILIETPYRNAALLRALIDTLQASTRLAVASALALPDQRIRSARVADWRRDAALSADLPLDRPAVFLFGP